ncbi:MAG: hypothetical protein WCT36_02250 [Candidatus Gracilibacteria bacterium]
MEFQPEQLYILILNAESLTDAQKQAYIDRLTNEGVTDALAHELMTIFEKEHANLGNFLEKKKAELEKAKSDLRQAEDEAKPQLAELIESNEKEVADAESEYARQLNEEVEGPFDREVESTIKSNEEAQIAAIRSGLKKK